MGSFSAKLASSKLNDWISLALVRLGVGGPTVFNDYAFVENRNLVPKIPN